MEGLKLNELLKREHNFTGKRSFESMPKQVTEFEFSVAQLKGVVESFLISNLKNENTRPLLLAVTDIIPSSVVSDGFTTIPATFTDKSLNASSLSRLILSDLKDKIIIVTKWHLELRKVREDRNLGFTVYLVIDEFEPYLSQCLSKK